MLPICLLFNKADMKVSMVWRYVVFSALDTPGTIQTMWFQVSVYCKQITNFSYKFLGMNVIARLKCYLQGITSLCLLKSHSKLTTGLFCGLSVPASSRLLKPQENCWHLWTQQRLPQFPDVRRSTEDKRWCPWILSCGIHFDFMKTYGHI